MLQTFFGIHFSLCVVVVGAQLRGVATIQSWVQVYLGAETERRIYELKGVGTEKQMAKAHTSCSKSSHRRRRRRRTVR